MMMGKVKKIRTIEHSGKIRVAGELNYASYLKLKNASWANGIISVNIKLFDDKPVAILFRYNDNDNYYGLDLSMENAIGNMKLYSKIEGNIKIYDSLTDRLIVDKWYRIKIVQNFDQIKVFIQNDKIRENKMVFNREMVGISRGSVVIANNGNTKFWVSGLTVTDYNVNRKEFYPENRRSWYKILREGSIKDRKIYCRDTFDNDRSEVDRCLEPHFYCQIRCDDKIPIYENVLNFSCFNDCVRNINMALFEARQKKY